MTTAHTSHSGPFPQSGRHAPWARYALLALIAVAGLFARAGGAVAQSPADWLTGLQQQVAPGSPEKPKEPAADPGAVVQVPMTARLTADGEEIEEGLVWRVYGTLRRAKTEGRCSLPSNWRARHSNCTRATMS